MLSGTKPGKVLHSASPHRGVSRRVGCSSGSYTKSDRYILCLGGGWLGLAGVDESAKVFGRVEVKLVRYPDTALIPHTFSARSLQRVCILSTDVKATAIGRLDDERRGVEKQWRTL